MTLDTDLCIDSKATKQSAEILQLLKAILGGNSTKVNSDSEAAALCMTGTQTNLVSI